jgi:hypothetical protein
MCSVEALKARLLAHSVPAAPDCLDAITAEQWDAWTRSLQSSGMPGRDHCRAVRYSSRSSSQVGELLQLLLVELVDLLE